MHINNKQTINNMARFCNIMVFVVTAVACLVLGSCQQCGTKGGGIVLNEICGKDSDGLEWIEIGNASNYSINLKGYKLWKMDVEGIDKKMYTFPDTILPPRAILTVNAEELRARIPYKKAVIVELYNAEGEIIDSFDSVEELDTESHPVGGSYARIPDLTGDWTVTDHATWESLNQEED